MSTSTRCSLSHSDFMVAVNESRPSCEVTAETGSAGTVWCVSGSCSCEDTALTRDGLPVLRKYDSSSITAAAASSMFRGRFCLTLKATWEFSICSRNWFSASRSRAFSASSGYALSASTRTASPKAAQSSSLRFVLAFNSTMYSCLLLSGLKRRCNASTHVP